MNLKALFTTIALLGSASSALARPATIDVSTRVAAHVTAGSGAVPHLEARGRWLESHNALTADASVYKGPLMLETAYNRSRFPASRAWSILTAPTRIERGRQYVTDLNLGPTSSVRLAGVQGWTSISQVLIRFTDGSEQIVQVNRVLTGQNTLDINIGAPKSIHGFVLYGETSNFGAYQILVR